jgi:hypothetical protein
MIAECAVHENDRHAVTLLGVGEGRAVDRHLPDRSGLARRRQRLASGQHERCECRRESSLQGVHIASMPAVKKPARRFHGDPIVVS